MTDVLHAAAAVCTVCALVAAGAVLARTRHPGRALPVLLELLLAAGLLRLTADASWRALAAAALVVVLRTVVVRSALRPGQRTGA